jgi:hypothetical protein
VAEARGIKRGARREELGSVYTSSLLRRRRSRRRRRRRTRR